MPGVDPIKKWRLNLLDVVRSRTSPRVDVLLSRQAVVDARLRVCGYRVAYATPQAPGQQTPDSSTTRLFGDVLTVVGLEQLVGDHVAHLPISRQLLLSLGIPPVGPDRVILRVTQEIALEPDIQAILRSLVNRGYALAVKADPASGFDLELLELFGTVELEFAAWDPATLATLAAGGPRPSRDPGCRGAPGPPTVRPGARARL